MSLVVSKPVEILVGMLLGGPKNVQRSCVTQSIGVSTGLEQIVFSQPCKAPPQSWSRMVYLVFRTEVDAVRGLEELDDKVV